MQKGDVRIGFGIMGGFNQAQAHAQFVAEHRRLRHRHPAGARGGTLHEADFDGCDVNIEALVPEAVRNELGSDTT